MPKPFLPQLRGDNPLNLTGAWLFCEGSGPSAADYVRATDAILAGTLTNGPAWVAGEEGPSLQFDGSDDRVAIPDSPLWDFAAAEFSLGFRLRLGGTGQQEWINQRSGSTAGGFEVWFSASTLRCNASGSQTILNTSWVPTAGVWYDLAFTRSVASGTTTNTWYVDGRAIGTGSTATAVANVSGEVWVGNYSQAGYAFGGAFDYLYVANRAWTADEVRGLKADPYVSFRPRHPSRRFVIYPSQTRAPGISPIALATPSPTVVRGALVRVPTSSVLQGRTSGGAIRRGHLTITPLPARGEFGTSGPALLRGAVSVAPGASAVDLATTVPSVQRGSISISASSQPLSLATPAPAVVRGSRTIDPAAVAIALETSDPALTRGSVEVDAATTPLELTASAVVVSRGEFSTAPSASRIDFRAPEPAALRGSVTIVPGENRLRLETTGSGAPEDVLIIPDPAAARLGTVDPQAVRGGFVLSSVAARLLLDCSWPEFGDVPYGERADARSRSRLTVPFDRKRTAEARARRRDAQAIERSRYSSARPQPRTGDSEC